MQIRGQLELLIFTVSKLKKTLTNISLSSKNFFENSSAQIFTSFFKNQIPY